MARLLGRIPRLDRAWDAGEAHARKRGDSMEPCTPRPRKGRPQRRRFEGARVALRTAQNQMRPVTGPG
eukprot:5078197-Prymnesium_polylepis.1